MNIWKLLEAKLEGVVDEAAPLTNGLTPGEITAIISLLNLYIMDGNPDQIQGTDVVGAPASAKKLLIKFSQMGKKSRGPRKTEAMGSNSSTAEGDGDGGQGETEVEETY